MFRNVLGTKNLGDILSERESIAHDMQVRIVDVVYYGPFVRNVKGEYIFN